MVVFIPQAEGSQAARDPREIRKSRTPIAAVILASTHADVPAYSAPFGHGPFQLAGAHVIIARWHGDITGQGEIVARTVESVGHAKADLVVAREMNDERIKTVAAGLQLVVQIRVDLVGVDKGIPLVPSRSFRPDQVAPFARVIADVVATDEPEGGIEARADLRGLEVDGDAVAGPFEAEPVSMTAEILCVHRVGL